MSGCWVADFCGGPIYRIGPGDDRVCGTPFSRGSTPLFNLNCSRLCQILCLYSRRYLKKLIVDRGYSVSGDISFGVLFDLSHSPRSSKI